MNGDQLTWGDEMLLLDPLAQRRDLKKQWATLEPSSLKRRELERIGASLRVSRDSARRSGGNVDHAALTGFSLTSNANRVFLLGGTLLVRVAASNVNGASVLDSKEGFVRKRVLLFNDVLLVCKAHAPTLDANGVEEYDDISIEGANELEQVLHLNEMSLNHLVFPEVADTCIIDKQGGVWRDVDSPATFDSRGAKFEVGLTPDQDERGSGGMSGGRRERSASQRASPSNTSGNTRSLVFEITHYKSKTKREVRLQLKTARMDIRDRWAEEVESTLLLNRLDTSITERPGWYYTLIKDGFYAAAYNGDLKTLKRLLTEEWTSLGEVNRQDEAGMTALMWAALNGHSMTCRLLLEHGADPEIKQTQGGNTAMHFAAGKGHVDIVRSLLASGAQPGHRNHLRSTPLLMAILYAGGREVDDDRSRRMCKVVHLLYTQGASVTEKAADGSTLLDLAIDRQLLPAVDILLKLGTQVNYFNPVTGCTPLQAVCATAHCGKGGYEMMRLLVGKGAHVNRKADPVSMGKALSDAMMSQFSQVQQQQSQSRDRDPRSSSTPLGILCGRYDAAIRRERKEGVLEGLGGGPSKARDRNSLAKGQGQGQGQRQRQVGGVADKENAAPLGTHANSNGNSAQDPLLAIRMAVDKERAQLRQSSKGPAGALGLGGSRKGVPGRAPLAVVSPDVSRSRERGCDTPASTSARLGAGLAPHRSSFKGSNDYNSSVTTPIYTGAVVPTSGSGGGAAVVSPEDAGWLEQGAGAKDKTRRASLGTGADVTGPGLSTSAGKNSSSGDIFRCILELTRVGARWTLEDSALITRPTMKTAVKDARQRWSYLCEPPDFLEFVDRKQRDGEILFALKSCWQVDAQISSCLLCGDAFSSFSLRKHHCRGCGVIVCDSCSSKRLQLAVMPPEHDQHGIPMSQQEIADEYSRGRRESFMTPRGTVSSATSGRGTMMSAASGAGAAVVSPGQSKKERCCDSCFVSLVSSALEQTAARTSSSSGASSDRHAIRQMRAAAKETLGELRLLIKALDGHLALPGPRGGGGGGRSRRARNQGRHDYDDEDDDGSSSSSGGSDSDYEGEDDDDDARSTSTRSSARDSLDERDPTTVSNLNLAADLDRETGATAASAASFGHRPSFSERLSSAVMVVTGCSAAGVGADGVYRTPALKLSLVHDDNNFRRSIRSNARLTAQTKSLIQAEKATRCFLDSAKVFQKDIGVVVEHE